MIEKKHKMDIHEVLDMELRVSAHTEGTNRWLCPDSDAEYYWCSTFDDTGTKRLTRLHVIS